MEKREKFINSFTDFGFKKLFGNKFNKEFLIDFLKCVTISGKHTGLTYLNTENQGKTEWDRKAVFNL
jgi:hypothetical protein